ncbi:MAG: hypothetical protein JW881_15670 [Spirochaetales bacterium]|nr:hypothetical protein [Spirochaetales bacterium]
MMKARINLPTGIFMEKEIVKISSEASHGSFTMYPRHIDCAMSLSPGILILDDGNSETYIGIDSGILVKKADDVSISVRYAIKGENLHTLDTAMEKAFAVREEKNRDVRTALAKLEISFSRRLLEYDR